VLPVVMLFLLGIMEYGRYLMVRQLFDNAAREGARYAVTHIQPVYLNGVTYGGATSDVTNVVTAYLAGITIPNQQTQVYMSDSLGNNTGSWTNAQSGNSIAVRITGNFQFIVPTLLSLPSTLPITATAVMDAESQ
jgi:Flp pilus assembly protein TadG